MKLAVVLGAGGMPGWAFHIGVARAIEDALDRSVLDADLVVGTSAGAAIGASLRAGASTDDLLARVSRPPDRQRLQRHREEATALPRWRRLQPLAPSLVLRGLTQPNRAGLVMAGALPSGAFPTEGLSSLPAIREQTSWPGGMWIPSVRVADGAVVVFGRDRSDIRLHHAVEASSAVPGMFRPVVVGTDRYVDGATSSANHADLAVEGAPDLVVISSVQTRPGRRASRVLARRQLPSEVARLREAGSKVVVVEPDHAIADTIANFSRDGTSNEPIVEAVRDYARDLINGG